MVCGNFLVIIIIPDDTDFIVDLLKFDEKEIFHFKRLNGRGKESVYNPWYPIHGIPSRVFLDMEWQRFYIVNNVSLHCYDFTGEKMFEDSISNFNVRTIF